jgi:hypothetical protein
MMRRGRCGIRGEIRVIRRARQPGTKGLVNSRCLTRLPSPYDDAVVILEYRGWLRQPGD